MALGVPSACRELWSTYEPLRVPGTCENMPPFIKTCRKSHVSSGATAQNGTSSLFRAILVGVWHRSVPER